MNMDQAPNQAPIDIRAEITPNPNTLKFNVNRTLIESGSLNFPDREKAKGSLLPETLFGIENVLGEPAQLHARGQDALDRRFPRVLDAYRRVDGQWVGTYWCYPDDLWLDGGAFAFPAERLILMQGVNAGGGAGDPLVTLRHELAHLALHEALGGRVPRWFAMLSTSG